MRKDTPSRQKKLERAVAMLRELRAEFGTEGSEKEPILPLAAPTFGDEEFGEAILALVGGRLTMGERVREFEEAWSEYVGVEHSVMVNSGSSANLLALKAASLLHEDRLNAGKREVITAPITWSTSVFPIYDIGCLPHFTDVEAGGLTQTWASAQEAVSDKTFALMPVHLMGIPTDIKAWADEAQDRGIPLIEDCCEAHGSKFAGDIVGKFGAMSTFSFFFSHHLTTIEGGVICTDDIEIANTLRSLRAHGWIRERSDKAEIARQHPEIDPRFLFIHHGYNVRPTEIQAAFGIHQVPKLEGEVERRQAVVKSWRSYFAANAIPARIPDVPDRSTPSWFGVPIILDADIAARKPAILAELGRRGVDSRPIMGGNFVEQPAAKRHGFIQTGDLPQAHMVSRDGFYIGITPANAPEATEIAQRALSDAIKVSRRV